MRYLTAALSGALLVAVVCPTWAQQTASGRFAVQRAEVSHRQAVALSALFPGLGQLATGHRYKGTGMVVGEVTCLVVSLTSHADHSTQEEQLALERERYQALLDEGAAAAAEESRARVAQIQDDLDGSDVRRWTFGGLAAALYVYSLVDVLMAPAAQPRAQGAVGLAPLSGSGAPGLAVVAHF
ncbi:MAG: hypothetical protein AB1505_10495 [Candidatus Latescibacterota bacterium]